MFRLHNLKNAQLFLKGVSLKHHPSLHVCVLYKFVEVFQRYTIELTCLTKALDTGAVASFLDDIFLSENVSWAQNHYSDILSLIHLLALKAVHSVNESRVLHIVQVLLVLHVRQKLHHIECLSWCWKVLYFLFDFKITIDDKTHLWSSFAFLINELISLEGLFLEVITEFS